MFKKFINKIFNKRDDGFYHILIPKTKYVNKHIIKNSFIESKKRLRKNNKFIFIGLIASIIFLLIFNFNEVAFWLFGKEDPRARGDLIMMILAIIVGWVGLYGLFINSRRVEAMLKQNQIAESGLIATRFNNAVAQLVSDNSVVVLGGARSLQQIAEEYSEYRHTIFDIFCRYLRENSTLLYKNTVDFEALEQAKNSNEAQKIIHNIKCPEIMRVIFRALARTNKDERVFNFDLTGVNFINLKFDDVATKSVFINAKFWGTTHENAVFNNCKFENAVFNNCSFSNVKFMLTEFINTSFYNTNFYNKTEFYNIKFYKDSKFLDSTFTPDVNFYDFSFLDSSTTENCIGIKNNISGVNFSSQTQS